MINNQELYDLSLQQLSAAQKYRGKIHGAHPIAAIRDDILMNKYNQDGTLKTGQKSNLLNIVRGFYEYLEWLKSSQTDIPPGYIRLYRGVRKSLSDNMLHYIPSSWTFDINIAADWTDSTTNCCILQLDYPITELFGINALPIDNSSSDEVLDKLGIDIHNQGEYEVILPAMNLISEGPPEQHDIDGILYTIYPVLANTYTLAEALEHIASCSTTFTPKVGQN